MLILCNVADTIQDSRFKIQDSLDSGAALEKFRQNIDCQNGDALICDNPESLLDNNLIEVKIKTEKTGFISKIDAGEIGESISRIGGGRIKVEDEIDFAVGYECVKKLGDEVKSGETLGVIFCRNKTQTHLIYEKLANAYKIEDEKPSGKFELIKKII